MGEKVFFLLKDPTKLKSNFGLGEPFKLVEATITNLIIQNCCMSYYTFEYDENVLVDEAELLRDDIDRVEAFNCTTQFIKEVMVRNNLT
jgi:hypothetical protein